MGRAHGTSRRTTVATALLAGAVLLLPGCGRRGAPGPADRRAGASHDTATRLRTDGERRGELIYARENCGRCHTLFSGPPARGEAPLPGPPPDDRIGSRVGPDLGAEGHRHSDDWHYAHLYDPAAVVASSRMPASRHLFRSGEGRAMPTPEAADLVAYLQALGRRRRDIWAEWRRREPDIGAAPVMDDELRERGRRLYAGHCAGCHGIGGDGRGPAAFMLEPPPRDLTRAAFRFKSTPAGVTATDGDLFRIITLGTGTGAAMPAFYWMTDADRWALVLTVRGFDEASGSAVNDRNDRRRAPATGRPPATDRAAEREPDAAGAPGEAVRTHGRALWEALECAACHGERGQGLSREEARARWVDATGRPIARSSDLRHACRYRGGASDPAIDNAVVMGVGTGMPSYGDALPDAAGRRALAAYLRTLDDDADH